ncbi:hypothetical protein Tco_0649480 [Tanacetum coccineum]
MTGNSEAVFFLQCVHLEKIEAVWVSKKKHTKTVIKETGQSEEVVDTVDSQDKEDKKEDRLIQRQTGVVIGKQVHKDSDEENLDHSKKLKGIETLSIATQFMIDMKKSRKASKDDFILQQCPKGSGEVSRVIPEVHDEPSGSSSSSSSESKDSEGFLPTDDEVSPKKSNDEKKKTEEEKTREEQLVDDQARNVQAEVHVTGPQKRQHLHQPPQTQPKRSKTKLILKRSKKPKQQVDADVIVKRLTILEKKVEAILKIDHSEAINKSVQAHLKKVLPIAAPDFGKLKQDKAAKQSTPKYTTKPFDEASLNKYDQKNKLMKLMMNSKSYNTHPAYKALYDALLASLLIDEDDMDNQFGDQLTQKKSHHDDQESPTDVDTDLMKRKRKDYDASPSKKRKDKEVSSKEGKAPSKSSKTDKAVDAKEMVQDDVTPR